MIVLYLTALSIIASVFLGGTKASAVIDLIPKRDVRQLETKDTSGFFSSMVNSLDNSLFPVYETGMNIITITFIAATIGYAMALLFKNGQWTKWSAGIMLFSLIAILILRAGPILFYSTTVVGVPGLIKDIMNFLSVSGVFIAIGLLLTSLIFKFAYRLIKHPDYHRWSRRLIVGSILVTILSTIVPVVFLST